MAADGNDLVRRLVEASELHGDFVLSSGQALDRVLRQVPVPHPARPAARAGPRGHGLLPPGTDHLAAPEGAATLLVAAVSLETGLPVAVVRKEPKAYGTREQVEGHAPAGAETVLLEDVSTTGHQVLAAAEVLRAAGVDVTRIVLAIDRGGRRPPATGGLRRRRGGGAQADGVTTRSGLAEGYAGAAATFRTLNDATISIVP